MNILVIGERVNFDECRAKFGDRHTYTFDVTQKNIDDLLKNSDLVFDFDSDIHVDRLSAYVESNSTIFINAVEVTLMDLLSKHNGKIACTFFGFCGMPTIFNRSYLEISLHEKKDEVKLKEICRDLNTEFLIVEGNIGLVTPRVICMIINEAYFTLEEGTASREDIDKAMKLGTNYPFGPFEWSKRIGLKKVYRLLEAIYNETKDGRYKVCSLLKSELCMAE